MKRWFVIGLVLTGAVALVVGLSLRDNGVPAASITLNIDGVESTSSGPDEASIKAEPASPEMPIAADGPEPAITIDQLAQEVFDQSIAKSVQNFRSDLGAFFREVELLPAQDYEPRARELLARVDSLAAAGYLTSPEALALRLSLLKYALSPNEYRAQANTLISDARRRAEQAEQEWVLQSDPKYEAYRAEERRIVEQSVTMSEFPDGMTRQAYLRERLRDLRSEIYSE